MVTRHIPSILAAKATNAKRNYDPRIDRQRRSLASNGSPAILRTPFPEEPSEHTSMATDVRTSTLTSTWQELADSVLDGETLTRGQALEVLECPDEELLELLSAVYRVRRHWFGNQVQLYFLM